jgi:hypothetical protein
MTQPAVVDARNSLDPAIFTNAGFQFASVGRPQVGA